MHEKNLYEYAVIRVLPRVEREEFLNVGIVLFCKKAKFIKVLHKVPVDKILSLSIEADVEQIQNNINAFEKVGHGLKDGGPIGLMDIPSRFRWLTAVRSSVIQTSRPHSGLCDDLEVTAQRLFDELVL
ncbi:DUF3037 domain-containing protein [Flavobacterium algicola]|uniref:DUF3037 domain-containing protein n=1 Tax=Flavobacterium algicola TaxID=556529 RepID=UPI001EFDFEBC|nr:DUF3037 domain-containing protein [Flavobacterium algicola]MCG9791044.1 DUF3037 domain-containing protein [Flavobacterium algicola]